MGNRLFASLIASILLCWLSVAAAAKPTVSLRCYQAADPVKCFVDLARTKLGRVTNADDRADVIGDILYTLSFSASRDAALKDEALELSTSGSIRPVKQMDLLYALDIYASATEESADQTYSSALRHFSALEKQLSGGALAELYMSACMVITWDDPFRDLCIGFARSLCTPEKLHAINPDSVGQQAIILAMLPIAMTLQENPDGFMGSAENALSWLDKVEKIAAKSRKKDEKLFASYMGILMHTLNALCLDVFDASEAADREIDVSLKVLRNTEKQVGISSRSTYLRRQVVDTLFNAGRTEDARKLLQQMLVRVDGDPAGKVISLSEQVAIQLQAARISHEERLDWMQTCTPDGSAAI